MTFQSTNNLYGFPQPLTRVFPPPIESQRAPTTSDYRYQIGQIWVNELGEDAYILVNVASNVATWNVIAITPGNVDTLTGDSGGAISPSAGNIDLLGTANEITTTGSGSAITWSLPATMIAPGSLEVTGLLTGDASATINTAGTALNLATDSDTAAVNLGTVGARTITVGNTTTSTGVVVNTGTGSFTVTTTGTGDIVLNSDDTMLLDADGVLELNSSAGVISIGNDADNQNINVGTAGTRTIAIGSATATETILGTCNINASGSAVTTIGTGGTGAVNIGNATGNTAVTGSLTASTTLTATLGAITATNGNLVLNTAGNKIVSTSVASTTTAGANSFGKVTLSSGTATVSTTAVTANSIIILTRDGIGATGAAALGMLSVGTKVAGTSFVINALTTADATAVATTDVSSVSWMIIN